MQLCCAVLQLLLLSLLAPVGRGLEGKYNDNALLKNTGDVQAVYDMLGRILPGSQTQFALSITPSTLGESRVTLSDDVGGEIRIDATTASELAFGVGHYFREYCNMTIGWRRGGGSRVFIPESWPAIGGEAVTKKRVVPWSYMMNVCTHSYSLVWYSWEDWEEFIDWMAVSGVNLFLALTGQEEIQYRVLRKFGVNDTDIRSWFNGPAFLTWSRISNEYGNDIAGPLPRSWMKSQHAMQLKIVQRYRSLGMSAQLPAFGGNVPIQLKSVHSDANITEQGDTGWLDSLDPLFGRIADVWMQTMIAEYGGTDHWYQLDGYFNGGTAPWMSAVKPTSSDSHTNHEASKQIINHSTAANGHPGTSELAISTQSTVDMVVDSNPACTWSQEEPGYIPTPACHPCKPWPSAEGAKQMCDSTPWCTGITTTTGGQCQQEGHSVCWVLRTGKKVLNSTASEMSYLITNDATCHPYEPIVTDPMWLKRGVAAYTGLNRTDPDAIWSFQGWAFIGWNSIQDGGQIRGFVEAAPAGKFSIIDMAPNGEGEWLKWGTNFWGANFVWTTLHNFGGNDGLKGKLSDINEIPFAAFDAGAKNVWGTGFTPEGIDQNTVYYEFMLEANWRTERVPNITEHIVTRSHRRYGLNEVVPAVVTAWEQLVGSVYSQDLGVHDLTGITHVGGSEGWSFKTDNHTPTSTLCMVYTAWDSLIKAGSKVTMPMAEPFRYDLVNTGREVLSQIAGPAGKNFLAATGAAQINASAVVATGNYYYQILEDVDTLVNTDTAFQLGPWLKMARAIGFNATDCVADCRVPQMSCSDFYEWNARVQLTTWHPVEKGSTQIQLSDYAAKQWSGLIKDYYAARIRLHQRQALADAAKGRPLDTNATAALEAKHAYNWTTAHNAYPTTPVGDALKVSAAMQKKYESYFTSC
jgi:hypothetical protein